MAEFVFISAFILIIYTYLGYPVLLILLSRFINRPVRRGSYMPKVTVVIPVHNEERQIEAKLRNCLTYDYPPEKLDIIVASDNSTDDTEKVIQRIGSRRVRFVQLPFRGGKVAAQNFAMMEVDSEIAVFTDVAITNDPDCIRLIVENFNDPSIGAVSCRDVVIGDNTKKEGESRYIQYDMMVREYTSRIGSLIGVTGGFYAVRSEIAKGGWNPAFPPDFYVALRTIKRGFRVIEDPRVKAYYKAVAKEWAELKRKIRTMNRGMHALFSVSNNKLLNPFRYGIVSVILISHKIFRWLTPFFIIAIFLSSALLMADHTLFFVLFVTQTLFFAVAATAYLLEKKIFQNSLFILVRYFVIANLAILIAWYEFIVRKTYVMWEPTKR